jgi:hypothetical protein
MTDHEVEQRLRTWYRDEVGFSEPAPFSLRADLTDVVDLPAAGLGSSRRLVLIAAAVMLTVAAIGSALAIGSGFLKLPWVTDVYPGPTPSGVIAFSVGGDAVDLDHVHLVSPDGDDRRVVGQGSCPTLSTDGAVLAFRSVSPAGTEAMVSAPDGSAPRAVPGVGAWQYALSPDGTRIAWLRGWNELWVIPVSGGPGTRIAAASTDANETLQNLVWSPDSRRVAFGAMTPVINGPNQGSYRSAIDVIDADGSNLRRLTARPGTDGIGFSWSPDGQHLVYVGLPDGSPLPALGPEGDPEVAARQFWLPQDVFVINVDGTGDRNVTQTASFELDPVWSPDGSRVAYRTFEEPIYRLATIRIGGSDADGPPSLGPQADSFAWSPTGAELLSVTMTNPATQVPLSTFTLVDADFQHDPTTLLVVENANPCPPSWQRIGP